MLQEPSIGWRQCWLCWAKGQGVGDLRGAGTALLQQASVEDRNEKGKELCLAL